MFLGPLVGTTLPDEASIAGPLLFKVMPIICAERAGTFRGFVNTEPDEHS